MAIDEATKKRVKEVVEMAVIYSDQCSDMPVKDARELIAYSQRVVLYVLDQKESE
jgi:hypothetical protein